MIENSNDETNFPYTLLLTDKQLSKLCYVFANGISINVKFPKTQLPKMVKSGEFLPFSLN